MRKHRPLSTTRFRFSLLASLPLIACAGSEPPALPPAPPPPVTASAAPTPPPPPAPAPSAAAPAPAAEAPPPEKHGPRLSHRHPLLALFMVSLDSLTLTPEQKTSIDGIKADLTTHAEVAKEPREKLESDVSDGVAAGKLDQKKIDADIAAMSAAAAATQPAIQDDVNRLHKALTPDQRKQLIETMRAKGKEMHEHGMAMHEHGKDEHAGGDHEHGGPGMHEHGGAEHEHGGPGKGEHGGAEHEHEHGGPGMAGGPLAKLNEELGLTPEQQQKIRTQLEAQMKTRMAAMKQQMAAVEKQMEAVGAAFMTDTFDAKKAGVGSQAPALVKSVATERVDFVKVLLNVLTPEQRPKFVAHLHEHNADME